MPITDEVWSASRAALTATSARFLDLVTEGNARTMATADWTVADTLAHVGSIADMYTRLVRFGDPRHDNVLTTTVDTVADLNAQVLAQYTERDPVRLTERLRADVADVLAATETADPAAAVPWLGDSRVAICGVFAHLINELHIHGRDIARATRTPWHIPPADAALFFEVFFVEMIRRDVGHLLDNDEPPSDRRIAVEFRSRHTTPVTLVLRHGVVTVEPPGDADVRIFFDPPALNLMLFHRIGKARAALTGKVRVSGRRPWLLPTFLKTVRCP